MWQRGQVSYQEWKNMYFQSQMPVMQKQHVRKNFSQVETDRVDECSRMVSSSACYSLENITVLSNVTITSVKLLQPFNNKSCTLMLMYNLAEAEWVSVECNQPLLSHVACTDNINYKSRKSQNFGTEGTCSANEVIRNGTCFYVSFF